MRFPRAPAFMLVLLASLAIGGVAWMGRGKLPLHAPASGPVPAARAGVTTPDPMGNRDPDLDVALDAIASELGIAELAREGRASLALVDLSESPARSAGMAADSTLGAASVAKLAILAAAYATAQAGEIEITPDLRTVLERMIRSSSNPDATRAIEILGFERIASALEDPRMALHDAERGGLWVGADYSGGPAWKVDPCSGRTHAASAAAVARFYALLARSELVSPDASADMREILSVTTWDHKFVAGLRAAAGAKAPEAGRPVRIPGYTILRKSGSFGPWQGDSALIATGGRRYILVCLLADREGGEAKLRRLAAAVDRLMAARHPGAAGTHSPVDTAPASP